MGNALRQVQQGSSKSIIEDTPMAATKKSLIDNSASAKMPTTRSEKTNASAPVAPSKMSTARTTCKVPAVQ